MDLLLLDDHRIRIPEFSFMLIGDSDKPKDYNRAKLLKSLGPKITILATIDTTRSGTIVNGRVYPAQDVQAGMASWTTPYRKAYLDRHPDIYKEFDEPKVLGRVLGGKFVPLKDDLANDWINPPMRDEGSGIVINTTQISDKDAVDRIVDGRSLTVSVGLRPEKMVCPFCYQDWADSMRRYHKPPETCEHRPGGVYDAAFKTFKGKMPFYFVSRNIAFDHIAETFRPAQPYASIVGWEFAEDTLRDSLNGETSTGNLAELALCDEEGHVVRLGGSSERKAAPPLTEEESLVLAFMDDAGSLDMFGEYEDGYDAAALTAAINKVRSNGALNDLKGQVKGRTLGRKGALPVVSDSLVQASIRFLDRYTASDRDVVGVKLLTTKTSVDSPSSTTPKTGGSGMEWAEIEALSDAILEKIKDLPEDAELCDDVLKQCLDADLYAKVDYSLLSDKDLAVIAEEEFDRELDAVAEGLIAADAKLSAAARKKLPESAFCGPSRSFPAHDEAHVRAGLRLLNRSKLSGEAKARTRACLVRRAKKYGIQAGGESQKGDSEMDKELQARIVDLEKKLADAEADRNLLHQELDAVKKERDVAQAEVHDSLVSRVFDLRRQLKKPDVLKLADEGATKAYLDGLQKRSRDSLTDSVADLEFELANLPEPVSTEVADVQTENPVDGPSDQPGAMDSESPAAPPNKESNFERVKKALGKEA